MMKKILIFLGVILVIFILMVIFIKPEIKYSRANIVVEYDMDNIDSALDKNNINWYQSAEDAFVDTTLLDEASLYKPENSTFICQFENEKYVRGFFLVNQRINDQYLVLELNLLKADGKYSQIVSYKADIANIYDIVHYKYRCVDAATQFINETVSPFLIDGDKVLYVGFWKSRDEVEKLNICNQVIDGVYELKFDDGQTIYMWYAYRDGIKERLAENTSDLTFEEEEKLLGIYLK